MKVHKPDLIEIEISLDDEAMASASRSMLPRLKAAEP